MKVLALVSLLMAIVCIMAPAHAATLEEILSANKLRNGERDAPSYGLAVRPDGRLVIVPDYLSGRAFGIQKKFDSLSGGTFGLAKREVSLETLEKS